MKVGVKHLGREAREQLAASVAPLPVGGCTAKTLRCANARSYNEELRPCCKGHLRQIVKDVAAVFAQRNVAWWADYGTLLGAVRNPMTTWANYPWLKHKDDGEPLAPGIIPHDKDADFGVYGTSYLDLTLKVLPSLRKLGYQVLIRPQGRSMKVRLSAQNHTNADFFLWLDKPTGGYRRPQYLSVDKYKGRDIPEGRLFPLTTVEWEGMRIPAPKDPEWFCEFRYGPEWRTPGPWNNDGVRR